MRVAVTGANGFVGQTLVSKLVQLGIKVTAISSRKNSELECSVRQIVDGIVDSKSNLEDILKGEDVVIHLAARVHVMNEDAVNSLYGFLEANLHTTTNLARQAASAGVKRFVYVSSIKVNGEFTQDRPFREGDLPHPQDAYAISKWKAEQALSSISRSTGMEIVIVRPPLIYGPRVKANFAKLMQLVDRGVPLPLGDIRNSRSLVYVGNLVDALIVCATHPAAAGNTYLISDGEDLSTPDLIDVVAKALRRPNRVFPAPVPLIRTVANIVGKSAVLDRLTHSLVIDSSKIRSELGWKPPYTMREGLQATAEWFRSTKREATR